MSPESLDPDLAEPLRNTLVPICGPCFGADEMRRVDALVAADQCLTDFQLMQLAGTAAFRRLRQLWPSAKRIGVLCGTGNNGGDGWVIAKLIHEAGLDCQTFLLGCQDRIEGTAREAFNAWRCTTGHEPSSAADFCATDRGALPYEVLVDALVGIGMNDEVRESFNELVASINCAKRPVLSLDAPSGLNTDTGGVASEVVKATVTVTFIAPKPGLLTGSARDAVGELLLERLEASAHILEQGRSTAVCLARELPASLTKPRAVAAHKGHFGHVLVVGGNTEMGGAAILAAGAALRSGAGLVTLATRAEHVSAALARHPEAMVIDISVPDRLPQIIERASVVVVGPGLGQDDWAQACLDYVLKSSLPLVIDADAINLIAQQGPLPAGNSLRILTPHPGEAARLAGCSVATIESDRLGWCASLAKQWSSAVILKGAGTIVDSGEEGRVPRICNAGNPGMATGGVGDVLAGLLGGLLAQGHTISDVAEGAVLAHAMTGDIAWREHGIGLTASDLLNGLGSVLTPENKGGEECASLSR